MAYRGELPCGGNGAGLGDSGKHGKSANQAKNQNGKNCGFLHLCAFHHRNGVAEAFPSEEM
jgi:hypothetical protein